ncbi:alpha/beta hydrolase [Actinomyces bowdenii]|uniref:Alpha/beta-hydrolase catalytic domain-containing protein n=1 Tax=Actinomyces bowdenii TaxID=131109 RepID=A0A3P1UXE7_9ACTO|nr:alpha/beta hydrolase [Actinomyces bowdenii]RRD26087.1 hypothetical protein EII10_10310 [Actinomyces bowdenii]
MRHTLQRAWDHLSPDPTGMVLGALFFILALTPSLLPRDILFQGVACGLCAANGHLLGVWLSWNWRTWTRPLAEALWASSGRSLPVWIPRWRRRVEVAITAAVILGLNGILLLAVSWQRQVAALTDSQAYTPAQYLLVFPVGFGLWLALVAVGRAVLRLEARLRSWLPGRLPAPARSIFSWALVLVLVFAVVNHAIPGAIGRGAEAAFSVRNDAEPPSVVRPTGPERSGSPDSAVPWETLGAYGKRFVGRGLSAQGLQEVTARPATEPIRVYAGLKSASSDEEVAALVVEELERTGAAQRSAVMIAPTTGTGWVDPVAAMSLELLYDGDTAIAAAQYSYLPSFVQFIADTDRPRSGGRALVDAVVQWWRALPADDRPRLLLYGESLGVLAGEAAFKDLADVLNSVDGVLWVGPPNSSRLWRDFVTRRDPGTREAAPVYSAGMTVRFAQDSRQVESFLGDEDWGDQRILYIQHASDPVVWWSPDLVGQRPDWLWEEPGADRSPAMHWMPYITFLQVSADLPRAMNVPPGHGHRYGTEILDGLALVANEPAFTPERVARARQELLTAMGTQPADD